MRIKIDPNRRDASGHLVIARLSRASDPSSVREGRRVVVIEPEDGVRGWATVKQVDQERNRVVLDVDWESFEDDIAAPVARAWRVSWIDDTPRLASDWRQWPHDRFPRPRHNSNPVASLIKTSIVKTGVGSQ